jgi:hypothetical protein
VTDFGPFDRHSRGLKALAEAKNRAPNAVWGRF